MKNDDFESMLDKETLVGDYKEKYVAKIEERITKTNIESKGKEKKKEIEEQEEPLECNATQELTKGFHFPITGIIGFGIGTIVGINIFSAMEETMVVNQTDNVTIGALVALSSIPSIVPTIIILGMVAGGIFVFIGLRRVC